MKNLIKPAQLAIIFILIINASAGKAQLVKPSITYGVTSYSYFTEDVYFTALPNNFFKSILTAPTIGLKLDVPKYHFGIETNYYQANVPSTDDLQYQAFAKTYFDVGVYGIYKRFKLHLNFASLNFRHLADFGFRNPDVLAFQNGIGMAITYTHAGYDITLRQERVFNFDVLGRKYGLSKSGINAGIVLKLSKSLSLIKQEKEKKNKSTLSNLINLQVGLNFTGNELNGETPSMLPIKIAPLVGVEFTYLDYQIYLRRAVWRNVDISYENAGKFTSLYNQIGFAYQFTLNNDIRFFAGVHHFWNYSRGQQYLDFLDGGFKTENLWFIPQNRGIGLELKYPFANNIDFILDADYYYEAHPRLGTGFNRESFRLSAVYNFR